MFSLGLLLLDSRYGALSCACATLNALILIDLELAVSHGDSSNGALSLARSTADASIANLICHSLLPPYIFVLRFLRTCPSGTFRLKPYELDFIIIALLFQELFMFKTFACGGKFLASLPDSVKDDLLFLKKHFGIQRLGILEPVFDAQLLVLLLAHIVIGKGIQGP